MEKGVFLRCKVCGHKSDKVFETSIRKKYLVSYFRCRYCGFLQTEEPYWLEEAYSSPINVSDTGIMARNLHMAKVTSGLIYFLFDKKGAFVDSAGGYGVLVRLMRDVGFDFYWKDKYAENLFARGFEWDRQLHPVVNLVTCFEAFEHFVSPLEEIEELRRISGNILFTTQLLPTPVPEPRTWWYYGFDHGQHIALYSLDSLRYIAKKLELNFYSRGSLHLLTQERFSGLFVSTVMRFSDKAPFRFVRSKIKRKTADDMHLLGSAGKSIV